MGLHGRLDPQAVAGRTQGAAGRPPARVVGAADGHAREQVQAVRTHVRRVPGPLAVGQHQRGLFADGAGSRQRHLWHHNRSGRWLVLSDSSLRRLLLRHCLSIFANWGF